MQMNIHLRERDIDAGFCEFLVNLFIHTKEVEIGLLNLKINLPGME